MRNTPEIGQERATLREWEHIQHCIFAFALTAPSLEASSWRCAIEECIAQATQEHAHIRWEPLASNQARSDRLIEIRSLQTCYGTLELAQGYLVSRLLPGIPQDFADLCALLIALLEYRALAHPQLRQLPLLSFPVKSLTRREQEVLRGLARGASETDIARELGIALTTVRTHRHRLFQQLEVHSPTEAVFRAFALRLLNWLDFPPSP
jgi:DNA-binding CsgD family transcriptional regulator